MRDKDAVAWLVVLMITTALAVWAFFGFGWAAVAASVWAALGFLAAITDGIKKDRHL